MALIPCPVCGHQISSRARSCPKCLSTCETGPGAAGSGLKKSSAGGAAPAEKPAVNGPGLPEAPVPAAEPECPEWYYVTTSGRNGPVSQLSLKKLAADNLIDAKTSVWRGGMPDWVEFSNYQEALATAALAGQQSPAVGSPSKWFFRALALAPAWGALLQIFATEAWVALTHKHLNSYLHFWWIIVLANLGAAALDFLALKKSGRDVTGVDRGRFLLVPVYIFLRDQRLQARLLGFGVWAGSLLASLYGLLCLSQLYAKIVTP